MKSKNSIFIIVSVIIVAAAFIIVLEGSNFHPLRKSREIGLVKVEGIIGNSERTVKWIKKLREDKDIRGILLYVSSPGGGVVASDEIYRAIEKYKKETRNPVVVYMSVVAASGGLYVSCGGDKIVANPNTLTGSIGVIAEFPQYYGLMSKIGIKMNVIKSGKRKDIGSPFRDMTPDERNMMQGIINETYNRFVNIVSKSRGIPVDSVKKFADGSIFTGYDAKNIGLVDTLGDFEDAVDILKNMAHIKGKPRIVSAKKPFSIVKFLSDNAKLSKQGIFYLMRL